MNRGYRVLIVEDEPDVRLVVRMALEPDDYRITVTSDGETALAWMGQEHFDAVLLDLRMPRMGGRAVLAHSRERDDHAPVIISALDRPPNVVQAVRLGPIDFLSKPITPTRRAGQPSRMA